MASTRKRRPYLLSTRATLGKFHVDSYEGYDFTWKAGTHRSYTENSMKGIAKYIWTRVIIPNAMIVKGTGRYIDPKDAAEAIAYAMTHGKSEKSAGYWRKSFQGKAGEGFPEMEWFGSELARPLHLYALDETWDSKEGKYRDGKIPPGRRYDLNGYLATRKWKTWPPRLRNKRTPALNRIINAFAEDRSIGDLTASEIRDRFGCSSRTAYRFLGWLEPLKKSGMASSALIARRDCNEKDDNTPGMDSGEAGTRKDSGSGRRKGRCPGEPGVHAGGGQLATRRGPSVFAQDLDRDAEDSELQGRVRGALA